MQINSLALIHVWPLLYDRKEWTFTLLLTFVIIFKNEHQGLFFKCLFHIVNELHITYVSIERTHFKSKD